MNSVERVKTICKERGIAISKLEKDLGFSNGYIGQLKKGVFPADRLQKISNYFNVTIEFLLTGQMEEEQKEEAPELTARDERDIKKDLDSLRKKLINKEFGPASYDGQDIPDEDIDLFLGQVDLMLRRVKAKNKEKYNPHKNKK